MARIFYQQDCDLQKLAGKTVAIIGYGSQGHAHALNLKDSGVDVIVGLYEGSKSWAKAEAQGLKVMTSAEAAKAADIIMILINDGKQAALYKESIEPNLTEGKTLAFAHGFNIHFGCIKPPKNVNVIMIAPKGPGHTVRSEYQAGKGGRAGCNGRRLGHRPCLCTRYRRRKSRRFGDHVPYRDRDRPLRRAGSSLRRRLRSDAGRLRDAG